MANDLAPATHEVDVGDDGNGLIKTLPAKVRQRKADAVGKIIEWRIKGQGGKMPAPARLFFPKASELFQGVTGDFNEAFPSNGKIRLTFKDLSHIQPPATYQYAIWVELDGKVKFAEGSSPPEVIIE